MRKTILLLTMTILASMPVLGQGSRIDQYVQLGETWLSDRLQMHWRTHATQQFMKGDFYHHCGGDSAEVPTLQINGARSHVTKYRRPKLEELNPRQEDERGMYLQNLIYLLKMEFTALRKMICSVPIQCMYGLLLHYKV